LRLRRVGGRVGETRRFLGADHIGSFSGPEPARDPLTLPLHARTPQPVLYTKYTFQVYDAIVIRSVWLSRRAEKDLERVPGHIALKLQGWVDAVKDEGLERVRRIPGYHDEPLEGIWRGHRSIRLNRAYRAIYRIAAEESLELVYVERITKHEY
jgi:toxin HigB-1